MSEYDLILLKKIRVLYGWKEDEQNYISKQITAESFSVYKKNWTSPPYRSVAMIF